MKKFLHLIGIGFALLFLEIVILIEKEIDPNYIKGVTQNTDYEKVAWFINFMENRSDELKGATVFIGPSTMQAGISDSLLTKRGLPSFNFGINHPGFDLDYHIMTTILQSESQPKQIFLARNKQVWRKTHKMSPLLMRYSDFAKGGGAIVNWEILQTFIPKRVSFSLDALAYKTLGITSCYTATKYGQRALGSGDSSAITDSPWRWSTLQANYHFQDEILGRFHKLKTIKRAFANHWNGGKLHKEKFRENSLNQSSANCKIREIYVPHFEDITSLHRLKRRDSLFFESYFMKCNEPVLVEDDYGYLQIKDNWSDNSHLSIVGAEKFSERILDTIMKLK